MNESISNMYVGISLRVIVELVFKETTKAISGDDALAVDLKGSLQNKTGG